MSEANNPFRRSRVCFGFARGLTVKKQPDRLFQGGASMSDGKGITCAQSKLKFI
jgi:hypothetical protein